ncbi:0ec8c800-63cc-4c6e-9db8-8bf188024d65-CDS [Sclerotinia trifoliorum]|uniref:0ec8c800-63cc-4c6e-9db8-8bf188024d65-CDS n=1 Tax=Sclerotinia trifoliorum TaxID=28548 RepID=A0A8H2W2F4_9HELO|nr:0ec8c800-63cc-4c6e-9db8-8bf188024d65-CDS [Sclerotinia trifoliorum]
MVYSTKPDGVVKDFVLSINNCDNRKLKSTYRPSAKKSRYSPLKSSSPRSLSKVSTFLRSLVTMDSKLPAYEDEDRSAPPSYLDSLSSASPEKPQTSGASTSKSTSYGSQIQSQLNNLSTQFSSLQTQKSLLAHAQEEKILSHLTTQIQIYLSEFANTGVRKGTLILIPAQCLQNEKAQPLDFDQEDKSAYNVFVEVGDKESLNGGTWFWEDEEMAERLATALKPRTELPSRETVAQKGSNAGVLSQGVNRFWKKKSSTKNVEGPVLVEDMKASSAVVEPRDKVHMEVNADEVVFEYENDFGLLETQRGYGVVLSFEILTTN